MQILLQGSSPLDELSVSRGKNDPVVSRKAVFLPENGNEGGERLPDDETKRESLEKLLCPDRKRGKEDTPSQGEGALYCREVLLLGDSEESGSRRKRGRFPFWPREEDLIRRLESKPWKKGGAAAA